MVIAGDLNQSTYSTKIHNFVSDVGLFNFVQEFNNAGPEKIDAAFENGSKRACFTLAIDEKLRCIAGIELSDCSEIVELDHRGHSTDVDLADYFAEELVEGDIRQKRVSNPSRKFIGKFLLRNVRNF